MKAKPHFLLPERKINSMDQLLSAAKAWQALIPIKYHISCGKQGKLHSIHLAFEAADFFHIAGFQYLSDIVFPFRFSHARLVDAVLSGRITEPQIAKSERYEAWVKNRLIAITHLQAMLEGSFSAYRFDARRLPFFTKISAEYLFAADEGELVLLFSDQSDTGTYFPKSAFLRRPDLDYRKNQSRLTILRIEREDTSSGEIALLYN